MVRRERMSEVVGGNSMKEEECEAELPLVMVTRPSSKCSHPPSWGDGWEGGSGRAEGRRKGKDV